jgi:hypothetical protein
LSNKESGMGNLPMRQKRSALQSTTAAARIFPVAPVSSPCQNPWHALTAAPDQAAESSIQRKPTHSTRPSTIHPPYQAFHYIRTGL